MEKVHQVNTNWSEAIREMISQRMEEEGETDMAEAVTLNERVKRHTPKNWDTVEVIKQWRRRTSM